MHCGSSGNRSGGSLFGCCHNDTPWLNGRAAVLPPTHAKHFTGQLWQDCGVQYALHATLLRCLRCFCNKNVILDYYTQYYCSTQHYCVYAHENVIMLRI
jgi:hypothetical protein